MAAEGVNGCRNEAAVDVESGVGRHIELSGQVNIVYK